MSSTTETPDLSSLITEIRDRFLAELDENRSLYHPVDIDRVASEEWQVKRFLLEHGHDVSKGFDDLCKSLRWKKEFGVHERTDQSFPKEIWELNAVEIYGKDKEGRVVQWEGVRNQRHFRELTLLVRQFVVHCLERLDRAAGEKGFILVNDCNGAGLANINLDLAKFKIDIVQYYPLGLKALYIVDQPFILNAIIRLVLACMNDRLRQVTHFVRSSALTEFLDPAHIPVELKGKRSKRAFPGDLPLLDQLGGVYGYDDEFVNTFYKTYKLERPTECA